MTTKEILYEIDEPVPFPGSVSEKNANFDTHKFAFDGDDARCERCDSKVWHKAAYYRCGEDPPRQIHVFYADGSEDVFPA